MKMVRTHNDTLAFSEAWDEEEDSFGRVDRASYYVFPSCSTVGYIICKYGSFRDKVPNEYLMYVARPDRDGFDYLGASRSYGIARACVASAYKEQEGEV